MQVKQRKAIQTGGTRSIETIDENKEIIVDSNNNPITQKIVMPKIEGAIVIAEGGRKCNNKGRYNPGSICSYRACNA